MLKGINDKKKEEIIQTASIVAGCLIYAIGLNMLITPLALYNGGFMGIAQLIRTFMVSVLHIRIPQGMDIAGAISIPCGIRICRGWISQVRSTMS